MIQLRKLGHRPLQGLDGSRISAFLRDSLSGLVFAIVIITYCISFSALIFQGSLSGGLTLGLSALLTTTMPYMKVVIDALIEKGIRGDLEVLVGGAPLNEAFAKSIGADAYCRDAAMAVETAKEVMARRQGSALATMAERA